MARHEQLYAGPDGWSPWRWPVMRGYHIAYRMTCCHCGLVHDMEVTVHKARGQSKDGLHFKAEDQPTRGYRIRMRFRENRRATGQVRRRLRASKESAE